MDEHTNITKDDYYAGLEDSMTTNANVQSHSHTDYNRSPSEMPKLPASSSNETTTSASDVWYCEKEAVFITGVKQEERPSRKLVDFIFCDSGGRPMPFENIETDELLITSVVMGDNVEEGKTVRVPCKDFGPIGGCTIFGYEGGTVEIFVSTDTADYLCVRPAERYRAFYDDYYLKACISVVVYRSLARSQGGDPNLTLQELIAKVSGLMIADKKFQDTLQGHEFILSNGEFVYDQLIAYEIHLEDDHSKVNELPVLRELRDRSKFWANFNGIPLESPDSGVVTWEGCGLQSENSNEHGLHNIQSKPPEQQHVAHTEASSNKFYIKISEDELANYYPLPAYYRPAVRETDEHMFFESSDSDRDYFTLPHKSLNNWSLYNVDMRLVSLELLPILPHTENDVSIFGSGTLNNISSGDSYLEVDACQSSPGIAASANDEGTPIYLGEIKEWVIEFQSAAIYIRTDISWYRLGKPAEHYAPWYEPVLKTARLATSIMMLIEEHGFSMLSFSDVIEYVSELEEDNPAYISYNAVDVEDYIVAHGQIIIQQFAKYPEEVIRNCVFVIVLYDKMKERHHTKLAIGTNTILERKVNLNPTASVVPVQSKVKVMQATMTKFVNKIWMELYSNYISENRQQSSDHDLEEVVTEEEEESTGGKVQEKDDAFSVRKSSPCSSVTNGPQELRSSCKWGGHPTGYLSSGEAIFRSANVCGNVVAVGEAVVVKVDGSKEAIAIVEYMFEKPNGAKMVHGRVMKRGCQIVLGNAANENELFLSEECIDFELTSIQETVVLDLRLISWGRDRGKEHTDATKIEKTKEEKKNKECSLEYYCKCFYFHDRGTFSSLQLDTIGLGTGACHSCRIRETKDDFEIDSTLSTFVYKKIKYHLNDFVYIRPEYFGGNGDFEISNGMSIGLKAYVVCHLVEIEISKGFKKPDAKSTLVKVRRFYRPEDISAELAYRSDIREIYYSEDLFNVPVEEIEGKCEVRVKGQIFNLDLPVILDHTFFCEFSYDPLTGSIHQLPANIRIHTATPNSAVDIALKKQKRKGKLKEGETDNFDHWHDMPKEMRLATLDIFAGCGGLTEGLQQSGVSFTKWAIEHNQSCGESFCHNHEETVTFIDDCNVILRAVMEKSGDRDQCVSTAEIAELAFTADKEQWKNLPMPGQVDFITGGLPCQEFPEAKGHDKFTWSEVESDLILTFLSFADHLRPRFLLLETGRDYFCFSEGLAFRLTIASLLEMGYQVRFGILEAGTYGVPQSRESLFLWAASPDETLPEWPEPMHVCPGPEHKLSFLGDEQVATVRSTTGGAPFRFITVRDAIADLQAVKNGARLPNLLYKHEPISWFQKQVRGNMRTVSDHITKEMEEQNLRRCERIPHYPGADWQELPDEKLHLTMGQKVDLIPWRLPGWAKVKDEWKGFFGRLHWDESFPASFNVHQTVGKVGRCFHPEQDRIITVRECARAHGFPDSFYFAGDLEDNYRQIGEAVPPPLAYVLGRALKQAVDARGTG